jgi:hypothetical protein
MRKALASSCRCSLRRAEPAEKSITPQRVRRSRNTVSTSETVVSRVGIEHVGESEGRSQLAPCPRGSRACRTEAHSEPEGPPSRSALRRDSLREKAERRLVNLDFASWNQIGTWLRRVEALRDAALLAWTTLVGFEHHVRVQPRRPPRGQPARPGRNQSYRHNHGRQRCGIRRLDAEQH